VRGSGGRFVHPEGRPLPLALPRPMDPRALPAHVLFPDEYRRSARMVVQDFVFFGALIVAATLGVALLPGLL
jgi:hypothetical protein